MESMAKNHEDYEHYAEAAMCKVMFRMQTRFTLLVWTIQEFLPLSTQFIISPLRTRGGEVKFCQNQN